MSEAIFVQRGAQIDYTPSSAVDQGDIVFVGNVAGVAERAIAANELGALSTEGVYDVLKKTSEVIAAGTVLYWNASTYASATNSGSDKVLGVAVKAAAEADSTVRVKINPNTDTTYSKATGAEVTTGTDDAKYVTAKALADAGIEAPADAAAAIANVTEAGTDSANIISALNALLAAARTHGIIAAS